MEKSFVIFGATHDALEILLTRLFDALLQDKERKNSKEERCLHFRNRHGLVSKK